MFESKTLFTGRVNMKKLFLTGLVSLAFLFAAPVSGALAGVIKKENVTWYRIHMSMGTGEKALSEKDVRGFVDTEITSRFPDGLTSTVSRGQWSSPEDGLIKETTVVVDVQVEGTKENRSRIDEVVRAYLKKFKEAKAAIFIMIMSEGITTEQHY